LIAFLGIGMFALPAGILGSGLVEAIQKKDMDTQKPIKELDVNEIKNPQNIINKIEKVERDLENIIEELKSLKKMKN